MSKKCKPKHHRYWRKGKWLCANCHKQVRWFANTLGWVHWEPKPKGFEYGPEDSKT